MAHDHAIEAVLARCLVEPAFLEAMRDDSAAALNPYGLDPEAEASIRTSDFGRIRRFSGFIGKVQHNHLWDSFPATRSLLCFYGIELDVFADYRSVQLSPEVRTADRDGRTRCFLEFLENHPAAREYAGIAEVLRHERALWEVRMACSAVTRQDSSSLRGEDISSLGWREFLRLVPRPPGPVRIASFAFDPALLAAQVCAGEFRGSPPAAGARVLAYIGERHTAQLRVLEIDALTALVLSKLDGRRRVRAVIAAVRHAGVANAPPLAFRDFFESAAASGLIQLCRQEH
jgi:hypothetical protein